MRLTDYNVPGLVRVVAELTRTTGDPVVNVFHLQTDASGSVLMADGLQGAMNRIEQLYKVNPFGATTGGLERFLATGTTLTMLTAYALDGSGDSAERAVTGPVVARLTDGGPLPEHLSAVITWRTPLRGRSNRGRTYLGPLSQGMMDANGRLGASYAQLMADIAYSLTTDSLDDPINLVVLSETPVLKTTRVTSATIDNVFDIQQRRKQEATARYVGVTP